MKLFFNKPSPYARKVRIVAYEKGLMDSLELHEADPWADPPDLLAANPLAKVPALITDDGTLLTESTAISLFFDGLGQGRKLVDGERWRTMARVGIAQGLIDAAFAIVIERRRPAAQQSAGWIARQRRAIARTLPHVKASIDRFDLGDISLACGLAYMDFRLPEIPWRSDRSDLAQWLDQVNQRSSMRATAV
jgi:glutathione S-transferase